LLTLMSTYRLVIPPVNTTRNQSRVWQPSTCRWPTPIVFDIIKIKLLLSVVMHQKSKVLAQVKIY
jgi:hypothetical protein